MPKVATRFAPSPTGPLHIGGVRTALFNWLFSKNQKGSFYLRIEDTDKERSKDEYKKQIIQSLKWIGIKHDDKEYIQSEKINDHKKVAEELLKKGFAYKCYCPEEEINEQKNNAKKKGIPFVYNRKWREPKNLTIPTNVDPVIRFKSKMSGNSIIKDLVQGEINISNSTIEDFVILRQDGSPTYQLSATVDDHLMNITHVIRGDDHKINTFKQKQIYDAMKWEVPNFAHIPLIHSNEGKEIFTLDESIKHFSLSGVGKSPSKLDMSRILSMNETYIKNMSEDKLYSNLTGYCEIYLKKIDSKFDDTLKKSLHFLKNKAKTLGDIYNNAQYIINDQINILPEDIKLLDNLSKKILNDFLKEFENLSNLSKENLEKIIKGLIDKHKTNFKGVGQPLRIALTGSKFGPGIYDIILSLDKNEAVKRLKAVN